MTTKLSTSLRKSILAEKESIDKKIPSTAKSTSSKTPVATPIQNVTTDDTIVTAEIVTIETQTEVVTSNLSPAEKSRLEAAVANSNNTLSNCYLKTIQEINQDLTEYFSSLLDINNIPKLQQLHLELLGKLKIRQQIFLEESLKAFMQLANSKN